ncbi:MAG: hypothetical protein PUD93_01875 [Lachnospiraceae bacterium]|nr:hypothetical protein [Lachnospiraceae bacterium]
MTCKKGMVLIMRKRQMIMKLFLAGCLFFTGCGNKEGQEAVDTGNVSEIQMTNNPEEREEVSEVQEQYRKLATENLSLQEQKKALEKEYVYYEQQVLAYSAQGFSDSNILDDLVEASKSTEILDNSAKTDEQDQTVEEMDGTVENADAAAMETVPETADIEEIEDAEAEKRIEELTAENEELDKQIAELQKEIEAYKIQCAVD